MVQILPIDYAIAIWRINPASEYRLNKSVPPDQEILEWRGPGKQPTAEELLAAWTAYLDELAIEDAANAQAAQAKQDAIDRLKLSSDAEIQDVLKALGIK